MSALFWFVIFIICLPVVIGGIAADDLSGLLLTVVLIASVALAVRACVRHCRRPRLSRRGEKLRSNALYHGRPNDQR